MDAMVKFFLVLCMIVGVSVVLLALRSRLLPHGQDRHGESLLRLRRMGGRVGSTRFSGRFSVEVYSDGIFVSPEPLFGLFKPNRNLFVPWQDLSVARKWTILGQIAELQLGPSERLTLIVPCYVANLLANVARRRWPEDGTFPPVTMWTIAREILTEWAIITTIGGVFFGVFLGFFQLESGPPIWFAFAFPGTFFGIFFLITFVRDIRAFRKHQLI